MVDLLYRWPDTAKFGRRVPKEKFYEHGNVNAAVREKFISEVQRVTWSYKLAEATINLPGTAAVPEVQVFTIDSKTSDVGESILNVIDKAIPFPIIFEITRQSAGSTEVRMVAAHKQLGTGAPNSVVTTQPVGSPATLRGGPCPQRSLFPRSTRRSCSR